MRGFIQGKGKDFMVHRIHLELNCAAGICRQEGMFLKKTEGLLERDYRSCSLERKQDDAFRPQ